MAEALAGGAVLGTLSSELYKGIKKLTRTSVHFKGLARGIKLKLELLLPLIEQIDEQNVELGLSNHCTEKLKIEIIEGLELVRNCSKVGGRDMSKKWNYTKELRKLDESLKKWLPMILLDGARDGKETLQLVRAMHTMMMPALFVVTCGVLAILLYGVLNKHNCTAKIKP